MMRGPRQDDDSVIENPLKLGLIQANPLAIGLLHASRNTRKLKITAAAECDRALLERSCEPEELKGVKWYESYNAILRDPDATTRVDSVFIGGTTSTRSQWAVAAAQHHKHVLIGCPAAADYEYRGYARCLRRGRRRPAGRRALLAPHAHGGDPVDDRGIQILRRGAAGRRGLHDLG